MHAELEAAADDRVTALVAVGLAVAIGVRRHALVALAQDRAQADGVLRTPAALVLEHVDQVQLVARGVLAEVDDDVEALGDGLDGQLARGEPAGAVHGDRVLHDVAVVGDQVERDSVVGDPGARGAGHLAAGALHLVHERELEVARHRAVQHPEAVAPRADVEVGVVEPVGEQVIADHPVVLERVVPELPVLVPGLAGQEQVHVVVAVAPVQGPAAGQAQVDAVIKGLIAAVDGAVVVHHRRVALEHVLSRVVEHVVVEPVRAHGLAVVAADLHDPTVAVRIAGARVRRIRVDGVVPGQDHRPAVVVELAREEERVGVAVALRRVVPVVLVGRDRVGPEAQVGGDVDRESVVVPEQDGVPVALHEQLRRQRAVEGPQGQRVLQRHVRVEADVDARVGAVEPGEPGGVVVQAAGSELGVGPVVAPAVELQAVAQAEVRPRAGLGALEVPGRGELVEALVGPALAGGAALSRRLGQGLSEVGLDQRLPGVLVGGVRGPGRLRVERLGEEGVQLLAIRGADGVGRGRERGAGRVAVRHRRAPELLEAQHLLGEALGAVEGARGASAGDVVAPARAAVAAAERDVVPERVLDRAGGAALVGALLHVLGPVVRVRADDEVTPGRRIAGGRAVVDQGSGEAEAREAEEACGEAGLEAGSLGGGRGAGHGEVGAVRGRGGCGFGTRAAGPITERPPADGPLNLHSGPS